MKDLKIHNQIVINERAHEIDSLQEFAFFLLHKRITNIWWKKGYFVFFVLNTTFERNEDLTKMVLIHFVDGIYYYKGDFKKYLITNTETQRSELVEHINWKTTEFAVTIVFKTPNEIVDAIIGEIEKNALPSDTDENNKR